MIDESQLAQVDTALDKLLRRLSEKEQSDHRYADYTPRDGVDVQQEGMRREDLRTLLTGRYLHRVEQS